MQARLFTRRTAVASRRRCLVIHDQSWAAGRALLLLYRVVDNCRTHTHNEHRDCLRSELKERVKNIIINASLRMKITAAIYVALLSRGVLSWWSLLATISGYNCKSGRELINVLLFHSQLKHTLPKYRYVYQIKKLWRFFSHPIKGAIIIWRASVNLRSYLLYRLPCRISWIGLS